jgi:hypothetical protein
MERQAAQSAATEFQLEVVMSLRNLLSLRFLRSRRECPEEAGLIISKRLKDLLANTDGELNATTNASGVSAAYSKESAEIEANDSNSPGVKTAA